MPSYRAAPRCYLDTESVTSSRDFAAHVDAFRRGERFPGPEPATAPACKAPAAASE